MFLNVGGILRRVPLTLRVKRDPQRPALLNRLLQGAVDVDLEVMEYAVALGVTSTLKNCGNGERSIITPY